MNFTQDYIIALETEFRLKTNLEIAKGQQAYMKDNFVFIGMKTPIRREVQQPFLIKKYLPKKKEAFDIVRLLWAKPERDFQLFGQELLFRYVNELESSDIELLEFVITHKSWWDTIDFIATKLVGAYFKKFPENRNEIIQKWIDSNHLWLKRSAILFQLKYKSETDKEFLGKVIEQNFGSHEFFINKAIGWALREYTRTDSEWVMSFVEEHSTGLSNLSKREALKLIK